MTVDGEWRRWLGEGLRLDVLRQCCRCQQHAGAGKAIEGFAGKETFRRIAVLLGEMAIELLSVGEIVLGLGPACGFEDLLRSELALHGHEVAYAEQVGVRRQRSIAVRCPATPFARSVRQVVALVTRGIRKTTEYG